MSVTVTKDKLGDVLKSIQSLVKEQTLVGIPAKNAARDDGPMNNAAIAYVQEFGSPANNIPARPFLIPGVQAAQPKVLKQLRAGATEALDGKLDAADKALHSAGMVGVSKVRAKIGEGIPPPLKPETIANRFRQRGTKSLRKGEKKYLQMIDEGVSPALAQTAAGIKPLVNTGELRNSITYVVRKVK